MVNEIQINERLLSVPGGQVYVKQYLTADNSNNSPVLFLHDSLGCVDMWRDFPEAFGRQLGRNIIAYDRLGFGRSSARGKLPSPDFIREEAEHYLSSILQSLGIDSFAIFGHSVGGAMAVSAAGYFGDRCEAVITESAQAFVEDRTLQGIRRAKKDFAKPDRIERLRKYHGEKAEWVLQAWLDVWTSSEFANWSLEEILPQVQCPLLAIHGDQDEYGSVAFPELIVSLAGGPAEKAIIPRCGHVPHRERPQLILDLAEAFLKKT